MPVVFRSAATTDFGAAATTPSPVVDAPAGIQNGDLLLMLVQTESAANILNTSIAGWTQIGAEVDNSSDSMTALYYKIASGEGSSWTMTNMFDAAERGVIAVLAYSGVDNTSPINTSASAAVSTASLSGPSVTPSSNGCMIVQLAGCDPGTAAYSGTATNGGTERVDYKDANSFAYVWAQDFEQTTAAAIALTATITTSDQYGTYQVALLPVPSGGDLTADNLATGAPVLGTPGLDLITFTDGTGGDVNTAADLILNSSAPTANTGTHANLQFETSQRPMMRFDLSSIPAGSTLYSARLHVYRSYEPEGTGVVNVPVYSVSAANGDWIEGVGNFDLALSGEPCWNAQKADGAGGVLQAWAGSVGCSTAGTDYETPAIGTLAYDPAEPIGTEFIIDLDVDRVQGWVGPSNTNYGLIFISPSNTGHIGQADNATAAYRPKLVVLYNAPPSSDLTPSDLVTGAPSLGTPTIEQTHTLTGAGIAAGAPVLSAPAVGQEHTLIGVDLVTGVVVFGSPSIGQAHALTASAVVTGAPVLGTPTLTSGQTHSLEAAGIAAGAPVIGSPALGQTHILVAVAVATGAPVLGTPVIASGFIHELSAVSIGTGAPVLGQPSIGQTHALAMVQLAAGIPVLASPSLSQTHILTAVAILAGAPLLGMPVVQNGVIIIGSLALADRAKTALVLDDAPAGTLAISDSLETTLTLVEE